MCADSDVKRPVFSISLDLEFGWAFVLNSHHRGSAVLRRDPDSGRGAVRKLLGLFDQYNIPATWAVVGHLFLDKATADKLIQPGMPQFTEGWIDWSFYKSLGNNPLYFGRDIIESILTSPVEHEIGLHSFFHILTVVDLEQFRMGRTFVQGKL